MKTVVLVPARQGSSRLPLKHLYPLREDGSNALGVIRKRLARLKLPIHLCVGQDDRLYEALGYTLGFDHVWRDPYIADGDLLGTLWKASVGFERAIVVYGDSPLIDARTVEMLPDEIPFTWLDGPRGIRPFAFTRKFLDEWMRDLSTERLAPFKMIRFPRVLTPWVKVHFPHEEKEHWTLDLREDIPHLRYALRDSPTRPLEAIREEWLKEVTPE